MAGTIAYPQVISGRGGLGISDHFAAVCSPVIDSDYDTCGTVTRSTINHLTVQQLDALFTPGGLFADLDAWFKHSIEMKACGTRRYVMYDWIQANSDRKNFRAALFPGVSAVKGPGLLHPFIMARQIDVVNKGHYLVRASSGLTAANNTNAAAAANCARALATTYAQGGTTYTATVGLKIESRYGVPMSTGLFAPMDVIYLINKSAGGVYQSGAWRVIDSVMHPSGYYAYTNVEDITNETVTGPYETFSTPTANRACYIVPGVNNVNDFEKWCTNRPTVDPRKMVPFWRQTWRESRCVDSMYKEVYARLMESNPAFREFGDLPLAERNRQDELMAQQRFVNSFFYNKPLQYQNLNQYQSLDSIYSIAPAVPAGSVNQAVQAYRANFIGVREQLRVCGQVFDILGLQLQWYEFLELNYKIKRARETMLNKKVTELDWWTNNRMARWLWLGYMKYMKQEVYSHGGIDVQFHLDDNMKLTKLGQPYFQLKVLFPTNLTINIITDEYWDDLLDQFQNDATTGSISAAAAAAGLTAGGINQESAGNVLACLDIGKPGPNGGSIYWAHIAANRKTYSTAKLEELAKFDSTFRCVMNVTSQDQTLMSQEGTAVVECPKASAWIENFKLDIPLLDEAGGTTGLYGDLY